MCFGIAKLWYLNLHNWVFLFSLLYAYACYAQKEKYANKNKSEKNQNAFKYGCKRVSMRCGSYRMYLKCDSLHQAIMIACECICFSHISNRHIYTYALLLCFHIQHTNSLLLLIHVQVQCDLAITRNTCVNICSLNCLNFFWNIKLVWLV